MIFMDRTLDDAGIEQLTANDVWCQRQDKVGSAQALIVLSDRLPPSKSLKCRRRFCTKSNRGALVRTQFELNQNADRSI